MLNIGGVKVAPTAIEADLKQVAGVRDAVAMSVSFPGRAERLVAALEIDEPPLPPMLTEAVFAVMRRHKDVFDVIALRSFPRTESAKIKRHEIEAAYRRSRAPGAGGP
jgi:acyl-CoA synthetase (AMP-forming)/AMP-acid ligase II